MCEQQTQLRCETIPYIIPHGRGVKESKHHSVQVRCAGVYVGSFRASTPSSRKWCCQSAPSRPCTNCPYSCLVPGTAPDEGDCRGSSIAHLNGRRPVTGTTAADRETAGPAPPSGRWLQYNTLTETGHRGRSARPVICSAVMVGAGLLRPAVVLLSLPGRCRRVWRSTAAQSRPVTGRVLP